MRAVSIILLLALAGCALPYGPSNAWRNGYSDQRISEDVYVITTDTSSFLDESRANQFNMRRAAEVTIQSGYTHFEIVSSDKNVTTSSRVVPGTAISNTTATAYGTGTGYNFGTVSNYNSNVYGSSQTVTTYTPARTVTSVQVNPTITIRMMKNAPPSPGVYTARDVIKYTSNL